MLDLWTADRGPGALILNATDADRGYQIAAAPFDIRAVKHPDIGGLAWLQRELSNSDDPSSPITSDIKLSSAVTYSATFPPILIDTARFLIRKTSQPSHDRLLRLVDGGYFESSGIASLLHLISILHKYTLRGDIILRVIVVNNNFAFAEDMDFPAVVTYAPITGILSTIGARGSISVGNLLLTQMRCLRDGDSHSDYNSECRNQLPMNLGLDVEAFNLPVAFHLSRQTHDFIKFYNGSVSNSVKSENECWQLHSQDDCRTNPNPITCRLRNLDVHFCRILSASYQSSPR
jgi:hypothetical protein